LYIEKEAQAQKDAERLRMEEAKFKELVDKRQEESEVTQKELDELKRKVDEAEAKLREYE
jgi:hypothetical protein